MFLNKLIVLLIVLLLVVSTYAGTEFFKLTGIHGQFGSSIAITEDGSWAAIGAPKWISEGAVYIYGRYDQYRWSYNKKIDGDYAANANYGLSIDTVLNALLIVGAEGATVGSLSYAGAANIYSVSSKGASVNLLKVVTHASPMRYGYFGSGVGAGVDGSNVFFAIGAWGPNTNKGDVSIWSTGLTGGAITYVGSFTGSSAYSQHNFGWRMSMDDGYLLDGSPQDVAGTSGTTSHTRGYVYVFRPGGWGGAWNEEFKKQRFYGRFAEGLDINVNSDGVRFCAGGPSYNTYQGIGVIYSKIGAWGSWTEEKTVYSPVSGMAYFGRGCATYESFTVFGAPLYNGKKGQAWVYEKVGSSWTLRASMTHSGAANDDFFGFLLI